MSDQALEAEAQTVQNEEPAGAPSEQAEGNEEHGDKVAATTINEPSEDATTNVSTQEQEQEQEQEGAPAAGANDDLASTPLHKLSADQELQKLHNLINSLEDQHAEQTQAAADSIQTAKATAEQIAHDKADSDARSVFVGSVDFSATEEEIKAHFVSCGAVRRVTKLVDKFTGRPKGFAYVEFDDRDSVTTAMMLNDSLFKGRQISVQPKRTNVPGLARGRGRGRGGFRGGYGGFRGGYRGGYRGYAPY